MGDVDGDVHAQRYARAYLESSRPPLSFATLPGILLVDDFGHDATRDSARLNKTTNRIHSDSLLPESLKNTHIALRLGTLFRLQFAYERSLLIQFLLILVGF